MRKWEKSGLDMGPLLFWFLAIVIDQYVFNSVS